MTNNTKKTVSAFNEVKEQLACRFYLAHYLHSLLHWKTNDFRSAFSNHLWWKGFRLILPKTFRIQSKSVKKQNRSKLINSQ